MRKKNRRIHDRIDFFDLMKPNLACPVPRMTGRGKLIDIWRSEEFRDNPIVPPLYLCDEWIKMMKEQEKDMAKSCSPYDPDETVEMAVYDYGDGDEKGARPDIVPPICFMTDVTDEEEEEEEENMDQDEEYIVIFKTKNSDNNNTAQLSEEDLTETDEDDELLLLQWPMPTEKEMTVYDFGYTGERYARLDFVSQISLTTNLMEKEGIEQDEEWKVIIEAHNSDNNYTVKQTSRETSNTSLTPPYGETGDSLQLTPPYGETGDTLQLTPPYGDTGDSPQLTPRDGETINTVLTPQYGETGDSPQLTPRGLFPMQRAGKRSCSSRTAKKNPGKSADAKSLTRWTTDRTFGLVLGYACSPLKRKL